MAIYRFETLHAGSAIANHVMVCGCHDNCYVNGYAVTKETYDRLLAELKANESAVGVDDGWKPASEPPDSNRDVIVRLCGYARGFLGFLDTNAKWYQYTLDGLEEVEKTEVTHWHELPNPPASPPQPEPVWQGPGWYECVQFGEPKLVVGSSSGCSTVRGVTISESDLTQLIRLATDEELRHVRTYGTEPDSRPE